MNVSEVAAYFANGLDILLEVVDPAPAVVHTLIRRFLHVRWRTGFVGSHKSAGKGNGWCRRYVAICNPLAGTAAC